MAQAETLSARKDFIGLDGRAEEQLRKLQSLLDREMPVALDRFYAKLRKEPAVAHFFKDDGHVSRAKGAQVKHWLQISEGRIDSTYIDRVERVGLTHARIGLEPRWYIGGYAIIVDHLIRSALLELWPRTTFASRPTVTATEVGEQLSALVRTVFLDMDIAIAVYFDASEKARIEAEQRAAQEAAEMQERQEALRLEQIEKDQAVSRERAEVVAKLGAALAALADRDLTTRLHESFSHDYRALKSNFNDSIDKLEEAMRTIGLCTANIEAGTGEITIASDDLARRTEQQAAALEQSVATLRMVSDTIRQTAASTQEAVQIVSATRKDAETSGTVVAKAIEAMGRIEHSSEQIGQIISVIDEIAFQTNLLALNAGVEAARAGEAGRGFAVVAAEVRALAQRAAEAAKQIKTLVGTSTEEVTAGVRLVSDAGEVIVRIVDQINQVDTTVSRIASAAHDETISIQQINDALGEIDHTTQQNAAMAEEASAAAKNLSTETQRLSDLLQQFRLTSEKGSSQINVRPLGAAVAR